MAELKLSLYVLLTYRFQALLWWTKRATEMHFRYDEFYSIKIHNVCCNSNLVEREREKKESTTIGPSCVLITSLRFECLCYCFDQIHFIEAFRIQTATNFAALFQTKSIFLCELVFFEISCTCIKPRSSLTLWLHTNEWLFGFYCAVKSTIAYALDFYMVHIRKLASFRDYL